MQHGDFLRNTRLKDTIQIIKSSSNWDLLGSVNSTLLDWNALPMGIKKLQLHSFRMSLFNIIIHQTHYENLIGREHSINSQ